MSGVGLHPRVRFVESQMACLRGAMPVTAVYLEAPLSIDFFAASRTKGGGSKSGSPTPKAKTSTPFARRSAARAFMASVTLGATTLRRFARLRGTGDSFRDDTRKYGGSFTY